MLSPPVPEVLTEEVYERVPPCRLGFGCRVRVRVGVGVRVSVRFRVRMRVRVRGQRLGDWSG